MAVIVLHGVLLSAPAAADASGEFPDAGASVPEPVLEFDPEEGWSSNGWDGSDDESITPSDSIVFLENAEDAAASSSEGPTAAYTPSAEADTGATDGDSFVDVTVLVTDVHGRALHAVPAPPAPGSVSVVYEIDVGDAERYGATFDACEPVLPATFADVGADHLYGDAIGCAAYYEVMGATSPGMFSPERDVNRSELAVILARLALRVGIDDTDLEASLLADPASPAQVRRAVDMLKGLGIVNPTPEHMYLRNRPAKRGETAALLVRLMDRMRPLNGTDRAGQRVAYGHLPAEVPEAGAPFGDIDAEPPVVRAAVERLWHLEVASPGSMFLPDATLTRAELAGFAAAVLDHSNARPRGLAVQPGRAHGDGTMEILVSWRDDDFAPVVGQAVEVLHGVGPGEALESACTYADAPAEGACTVTDDSGNMYLRGLSIEDQPRVVRAQPGARPGGNAPESGIKSEVEVEAASSIIPPQSQRGVGVVDAAQRVGSVRRACSATRRPCGAGSGSQRRPDSGNTTAGRSKRRRGDARRDWRGERCRLASHCAGRVGIGIGIGIGIGDCLHGATRGRCGAGGGPCRGARQRHGNHDVFYSLPHDGHDGDRVALLRYGHHRAGRP